MKKILLAIAITTLFTTTAQTAIIYDKNGVTVDIYGDVEVQFFKSKIKDTNAKNSDGSYKDDQNGENQNVIRIDDADFGFKLAYDIGNGLKVIGKVEFSGEKGTATLGDTFVGVKSDDWGTLTVGKQATIYDDAGIGGDYEFGATSFYEQDKKSGHQVIKYKFDKNMFYGGVAYLFNSTENVNNSESAVDAKFGVRVVDFDFTAFIGQAQVARNPDDVQSKTDSVLNYTLEARYQLGDLGLAITYAGTDATDKPSVDKKGSCYGTTAIYKIDKITFGGGIFSIDNAATSNKSQTDYYLNVAYAFSPTVKVFTELGGSSKDNTELGYVAGLQIKF